MGIYNCRANFHPFFYRYISHFTSLPVFAFSFFFILHTLQTRTLSLLFFVRELRFYHLIFSEKGIFSAENFLLPQSDTQAAHKEKKDKLKNLQQFFRVFCYKQDQK